MKRILITGGHAGTTALSIVEELASKHESWKIHWVGTSKAIEGKSATTLEHKVFTKKGISYHQITTGRLQRKLTRHTIVSLLKIPIGMIQAILLIAKYRPKVILSFGGFAALPAVIAGWIFRVPVVIHEQTAAIGLANKLSIPFAKRIALARNSSYEYVPKNKSILVGNPLLKSVREAKRSNKLSKIPNLYITGGSRGSVPINNVVAESLLSLLEKYNVTHLSGHTSYKKFKDIKARLPKKLQDRYSLVDFLHPDELLTTYSSSHIAVSRAGANTVAELVHMRIPSILIPIPWTRYDEQTKNAEMAANTGIATVVKQSDFNKETLLSNLDNLVVSWAEMKDISDLKDFSKDIDAHTKLTSLVISCAN